MDLPVAHAVVAGHAGGNIPVAVPLASPGWRDAVDAVGAVDAVDAVDAAWRIARLLRRLALLHAVLLVWVVLEGWPSWLLLLLAVPAAGYCGAAGHRRWLLCAYAAACIAMVVGRIVLFLALSVGHGTALLLGGLLELAVPSAVAGYVGAALSTADLRLLRAGWRPLPHASPWGCSE
jgi:hypothetical protein